MRVCEGRSNGRETIFRVQVLILPWDSDCSRQFMWRWQNKLQHPTTLAGLSLHASGSSYLVSLVQPTPNPARSSAAAPRATDRSASQAWEPDSRL